MFCKGSDGAIIVYDVSNKESFDNVEIWKKDLEESISEDVPIFLWGNKIDQVDSRIITSDDGCNIAEKLNIGFVETSAKNGTNIHELFTLIASNIIDNKA